LDAKLLIIGDGPERGNLQELIAALGLKQHVQLPGYSANPWSSMGRADVFVLPSEEEAFGLVLVEAMACGVTVVATDAVGGGPRSILEDGRNGVLVPSHDPHTLARAIIKVISSQDLRNELINAGKRRCKAFQPETIAQQWLSFIEVLSANREW
jgi:glycosyltransferase involved in cell wall biosynthesis